MPAYWPLFCLLKLQNHFQMYSSMSVPSLIYTSNIASCTLITGLLMSVPAINKSEANVTFGYRGRQPLFNRGEVIITGNPRVVQGPFGSAIKFTELDSVVYRFSATEPFPCPFDILQCRSGFTMSFWIQLQNATVSLYREYMKLGNRIIVRKYRSPYSIRFRMFADKYRWFNKVRVAEEWTHMTIVLKMTESLIYINGQKRSRNVPKETDRSVMLSNELWLGNDSNPGEFSIGNVELWSGTKQPVFIWRLYQEGLLEAWSVLKLSVV